MKTYLITGGAGFIGSNFVHYILKKYNDVKIINVDVLTYAGNLENLSDVAQDSRYEFVHANICDQKAIANLFKNNNVDYVVNFAAESHVDRSIKTPLIFVETNINGTANLLNIVKEFWNNGDDSYKKGCKFVQVSTDEVYGSLGEEGFFTETTPICPHSPYSASKAAADLLAKAYFDTFKLPINITRCSNNYGPYQFPEKLIPLTINNAINHQKIPVYGDGMNIRDWLFVEDHCKAIDMVINGGKTGEVYNIGGHNERTNITIVKTIIEHIKNAVDPSVTEDLLTFVEDRKGHDRRYGIDPEKIRADLGWAPETAFEVGIKKTINWYLENKWWLANIISGEISKMSKKETDIYDFCYCARL